MVWKYAFDRDKAQVLTLHLIKCSGKIEERHVNRKRLITQLKKIRSLRVDRKLAEHIDELERRINELVATEKKIQKNQVREDLFHRQLIDKINRLDQKLKNYLAHHKYREQRFRELEQKVYKTLTKEQKVNRIKGQISGLEVLYRELVSSKTAPPSQVQAMRDKIDSMKHRMLELGEEASMEAKHRVIVVREKLPPHDLFAKARKEQVAEELGPAPPPPE